MIDSSHMYWDIFCKINSRESFVCVRAMLPGSAHLRRRDFHFLLTAAHAATAAHLTLASHLYCVLSLFSNYPYLFDISCKFLIS